MLVALMPVLRELQRRPIVTSAFLLAFTCFVAAAGLLVAAQNPSEPVASHHEPVSVIRAQTNLILVRVVVRDAAGNPVSGLDRTDFKLFDNNKEQPISYFAPDAREVANPVGGTAAAPAANQPQKSGTSAGHMQPQRFSALFFDDYHMEFGDLVQIREAAKRYLGKHLDAGERVAVVSASGNIHVGFTNDRNKLEEALSHLARTPRFQPSPDCPQLPTYLAQRVEAGDQEALQVAEGKLQPCFCHIPPCHELATLTRGESNKLVRFNEQGAVSTLSALDALVRRMAQTPGGERTIAMVSDGFLDDEIYQFKLDALIDRALRERVVINALDAKGLYVDPGNEYERQGMKRDGDVMLQAAEGTGGIFVENTNDMEGGLSQVGDLRLPSYVIGFAPTDLKYDGQFHILSLKLASREHLTVQARRGYFAPKQAEDPTTAADEKVEQAMFSAQEMSELPVQFSVKFDKVDAQTTKFSITASIDLHSLRFRKDSGNNLDDVTLMVALFDADGNYVTGQKKTLKMHLSEATLRRLEQSGATITEELNVKPGAYMVRAVLGESQSQQMGAASETVEIP